MRKLGIRGKIILVSLAVLASAVAGGVVLVNPASAAPSCNSTSAINRNGQPFELPTIGFNSGNINCELGFGNQSSAVRSLQTNLNLCYFVGSGITGRRAVLSTRLSTDGIFGSRTRNALAAVQRAHGIADDGRYGPQTRRTILFVTEDGRPVCERFGA